MSAARSIPIDDATTALAIRRAEHVDDLRGRLAYARGLLLPALEAAIADEADAEDELDAAIAELHACRRRRGEVAELLFDVIRREQEIDPIRVAGAMEAIDGDA